MLRVFLVVVEPKRQNNNNNNNNNNRLRSLNSLINNIQIGAYFKHI